MHIDKRFFDSAFIKDQFKLSGNEANHLFETAAQPLTIKLMMLEIWGRLFIENAPLAAVQEDLLSCTTIRSRQ
jgi:hypothetical protein